MGKPKEAPLGRSAVDQRFAAVQTDPRFQRLPKAQRTVQINDRFKGGRTASPAALLGRRAGRASGSLCRDVHRCQVPGVQPGGQAGEEGRPAAVAGCGLPRP